MINVAIVENGRTIDHLELNYLPRKDDIISIGDYKAPYYLVKRVEHVVGFDFVNLHVIKFANQTMADIEIDGFRNNR